MTTLYFHIGFPKTGTSSIQTILNNNYSKLLDHNCLYPRSVRIYPFYGVDDPNYVYIHHGPSTSDFFRNNRPTGCPQLNVNGFDNKLRTKYTLVVNKIEEEISKTMPSQVIISSEGFCFLNEQQIQFLKSTFLPKYNSKIIIYLRRQDEFLTSVYMQQIKMGRISESISKFIDRPQSVLDYFQLLIPWIKNYGKENIIVRVFERKQLLNEDIIDDFFNCLNLNYNNLDLNTIKTKINVSPSKKIIKVMQYLNLIFKGALNKSEEEVREIYLKKLLNNNEKITRLVKRIPDWLITPELLSKEQRIELMHAFEESNTKVAKEYLNRPDGKLFNSSP